MDTAQWNRALMTHKLLSFSDLVYFGLIAVLSRMMIPPIFTDPQTLTIIHAIAIVAAFGWAMFLPRIRHRIIFGGEIKGHVDSYYVSRLALFWSLSGTMGSLGMVLFFLEGSLVIPGFLIAFSFVLKFTNPPRASELEELLQR